MKYYDTYEEAKAAYPDCDAVLTPSTDELTEIPMSNPEVGKFVPVKVIDGCFVDMDRNDTSATYRVGIYAYLVATGEPTATPPKPTRTTYEKVEFEHAWELLKLIEDGNKVSRVAERMDEIQKESVLNYIACGKRCAWVEVEKEIDWRDEVEQFLREEGCFSYFEPSWTLGSKNYSDEQFLEMCRTALRATGELE